MSTATDGLPQYQSAGEKFSLGYRPVENRVHPEAGKCLVMQARVADKPVIIVLLDSAGKLTRIGDANRIKRWMETTQAALARKHGDV